MFRVSADGRTVVAEGPDSDLVADILERYVRPLVHQLLGRPCFHGSGVAYGDRGVGFLGPTGTGKSTLASMLAERGAAFVCDDALMIAEGLDHRITVTTPCARLLPSSIAALLDPTRPTRLLGEKTEVCLPPPAASPALAALFVLGSGSRLVDVARLSRRDAIAELAVHLRRLDPGDPSLLAKEFAFLEGLATDVLVARLDYPRNFGAIDAVRAAILAALP